MTRARRWLNRLNPFTVLLGPVFEKEVYVSGRKAGTYIVRGLACLALLAVLMIACSSLYFTVVNPAVFNSASDAADVGGAYRLQQLQSTSSTLAAIVGWFSFVLLLLVAPVFIAPSVMEEVRNRTLPALLTTPLTASDIILGKVTGRGVQILILALVPIPILLIARTFGGVPLDGILAFGTLTFAAVLEMAAISIAISVVSRRSASAIVLAYCLWIGVNAAPPIALAYITNELHWFRMSDTALMSLSAPVAMGMTTVQKVMGQAVPGGQSLWIWSSMYHSVVAVVLLGLSIALMRRAMTNEGTGGAVASDSTSQRKPKKASVPASARIQDPMAGAANASIAPTAPIVDAEISGPVQTEAARDDLLTQQSKPSRIVADDPVLWRELRSTVIRKSWHRWVLGVATGIITCWIMYAARNDGSVALPIVLGILLTVALLQAAVLTTASISTERESKTWETLLTTPLSGGEILWSKLAGALAKMSWPILAGLAFALVFGVLMTGCAHPYVLMHWLLVCVGPCFFLACTGVLCGLVFPRPTVAAVFNLGLALAIWAALPMVLLIVGQSISAASGFTRDADLPARITLLINPYAWFGMGIEACVSRHRGSGIAAEGVDILNFFRIPLSFFLVLQLIFTGIFIAAGMGVMMLAGRLFPVCCGRTPPESPRPIQATLSVGR